MLETEDTVVVYSAQQPWSEAGAEAGKECPEEKKKQHFLPEWEALSVLETEDTVVVYSAQQPWSEAGPGAGK